MSDSEQSSTPPSAGTKRSTSDSARAISPPPLKRRAQAAISKGAVASFFTPTSQKAKERTTWTERSHDGSPATLLVAKHVPDKDGDGTSEPPKKQSKIAAFDLDSTLITSASGKRHANDAADWKWWHHCVPGRLQQLYREEGYQVVIFTNQGGLVLHPDPKSKTPKNVKDRVAAFKQKCNAVLGQLGIPIILYAATGKDIYRKPRPGMWAEMKDDYDLADSDIDLEDSVFVGDAGGRVAELKGANTAPKDFSCSDRNLAGNIGIPFQTPEEFFLGEEPREFARDFDLANFPFVGQEGGINSGILEKANDKDIVMFVGPPGAGKSTFYWKYLKPLGYERVNQDILKSKDKCFKAAAKLLQDGNSVVVDNTNPDTDTRSQWVALARKHNVPIRCVWFRTPLLLCEHNAAVRSMSKTLNPEGRQGLPRLAFTGFASRFKEPKLEEGFQDIVPVEFEFRGTKEEYDIWGRYWL